MCGIAGYYSFSADRGFLQNAGAAMQGAIAHRGPDSSGVWVDPDAPLVLSHRRLAIVDLSADGAQPMHSPSGRFVVVYNGEIYNHRDLRAALENLGREFKTSCDTEVLLHAFEVWGLDGALEKLNGMFAFALWDRRDRTLHFARDRFGKKPLYIGWTGKGLAFASELKAFHTLGDFSPEIDRDCAALYMRHGFMSAPHSIFKNVWQLLPAGCLSLDMASLQKGENLIPRMRRTWSLRSVVETGKADLEKDDEAAIIEHFDGMVSRAVRMRMDCDVPFGSFLSGGIDSSLVTAIMRDHSSHAIKTFSIGFHDAGYDESAAAAKIAAHLGTDHHTFMVGEEDMLGVVPMLPDMYDEPFADASQIPTHLVSRLARDHVTVALTGDGGDELLGGYQRHTHIPPLWDRVRWMPASLRQKAAYAVLSIPQDVYDRLNPAYHQFGRRLHRMAHILTARNETDLYATLMEPWGRSGDIVPGSTMPSIPLDDPAQWPDGLTLAERMIFADLLCYRPDDLMVKTDRASMAVALEARAPLMDHELCEYSWRLPHSMKIRGLEGKWLLRRLLEKRVPKDLFDRPKTGFGVPLARWLKGPLKGWASDLLDETHLKNQGIVNAPLVAGRWRDFLAGKNTNANANDLWTALMFQAWHDRWMKGHVK